MMGTNCICKMETWWVSSTLGLSPGSCLFLTIGLSSVRGACFLSLPQCFSSQQQRGFKKIKNLTIAEEVGKPGVWECLLNCQLEHLLPSPHLCTSQGVPGIAIQQSLTIRLKIPWGRDRVSRLFCSSWSTFSNVEDGAGTQQGLENVMGELWS